MVAGRELDRIRLQPGKSELSNLYDAPGWQRCAPSGSYGRTRHRPEMVARWEDDLFHDMRQVRVQRRLSDLRGKARRVFGALARLTNITFSNQNSLNPDAPLPCWRKISDTPGHPDFD
jgi:hypothetical protein